MQDSSVKVVHCKKQPYDVYIGRPSKFGNPFSIGKDGTREEVTAKYEAYIMTRPDLIQALPELIGKTLGYWCKQTNEEFFMLSEEEACHGDILKRMVEDEIWLK